MRRAFVCCALMIAMLPAVWQVVLGRAAVAQSVSQKISSGNSAGQSSPSDYVGSEVCATCHSDITTKFGTEAHSRLALMHGGKGVTCEECHGPGKAHVESGGEATKTFQFTKASVRDADAKCLYCHADSHPNFTHSAHGEAGVSCISCHSIHAFERNDSSSVSELRFSQPRVCYQCHTDIKAAFDLPFHHKVNEGLVNCSDCHDPHGTFDDKLLKKSADQNAVCIKCHAETAGPFVYEHPPIKLEGCTSCHFPHGSPNARLLTRNDVNSLCLQCHTASMNFTAPGTPSFHNLANQYQACTVCHTQIHGSNASNVFFK
jgi:DmsE family decaheme c-type cytochrome